MALGTAGTWKNLYWIGLVRNDATRRGWMLDVVSHEKFQGAPAGEDFLLQPCTRIGDGLYTLVVSGCLIFHLL